MTPTRWTDRQQSALWAIAHGPKRTSTIMNDLTNDAGPEAAAAIVPRAVDLWRTVHQSDYAKHPETEAIGIRDLGEAGRPLLARLVRHTSSPQPIQAATAMVQAIFHAGDREQVMALVPQVLAMPWTVTHGGEPSSLLLDEFSKQGSAMGQSLRERHGAGDLVTALEAEPREREIPYQRAYREHLLLDLGSGGDCARTLAMRLALTDRSVHDLTAPGAPAMLLTWMDRQPASEIRGHEVLLGALTRYAITGSAADGTPINRDVQQTACALLGRIAKAAA
jgi:hypothetical protein